MASPAAQSQANALNARMEGEARTVIDEIDKALIRPILRSSYACIVKCYDKAGKNGTSEQIDHCSRNCQASAQQAQAMVQNEVGQFQNRLQRAMMQCQDEAQDIVAAGSSNDARRMKKAEDALINCMSKTVDSHIGLLYPMKDRISKELKNIGK